jgi:hypothetical protein
MGTLFRQDGEHCPNDNNAYSIDGHAHHNEEWTDYYENIAAVIRNIRRGRRYRDIVSYDNQVVEPNYDYDFCNSITCLEEDLEANEETGSVVSTTEITRC